MSNTTANGGRIQPRNPYYGLKIVQTGIAAYAV